MQGGAAGEPTFLEHREHTVPLDNVGDLFDG